MSGSEVGVEQSRWQEIQCRFEHVRGVANVLRLPGGEIRQRVQAAHLFEPLSEKEVCASGNAYQTVGGGLGR